MKLSELKVEEYTSPCTHFVDSGASLELVIETMKSQGIRHMPVMDQEKVVGIISERDLALRSEKFGIIASELMTKDPYIVYENTPLAEVAFKMSEQKIGSVLVQDSEEALLGIFTTTDALNALVEVLRGDLGT